MLTFPPAIPTTLIPLPCSTSPMTSLHHMGSIPASQWSIDSSDLDQISMPTRPPFACFLPWYQPVSTRHSYYIGDPFVHGHSHIGYTFEGLTGRMRTNEIGERMHEVHFRWVWVLPQEDDILAWIIQPRRHTLNHVPAWRKVLRRLTRVFPRCSA